MPSYFDFVERDGEYCLVYEGNVIPDSEVESLTETGAVRVCYHCATIGYSPEFTSFQSDSQEVSFCSTCANEYCTTCESCDTFGSLTVNLNNYDIARSQSRRLCRDCYENNYARCHSCGVAESRETIIENEGRFWCTSCGEDKFPKCKYCSNRHLGKRICRCHKEKPAGFLTNRYFSVEVELIDPNGESTTSWKNVHDGSLSSGGKEYISGPLVGEKAIEEITVECSKMGGYIDNSCGFHLHLDFGDETPENVVKFAAACQVLEPFAFSLVTRNRDNSRFCKKYDKSFAKRLKDLPLDVAIYDTTNSSELNRAKTHKYHQSRYHWVNLHSFYFRGTIEIRHHHGTKNAASILRWAELWLKVAEWSKTKDYDSIVQCSPEHIIESCGLREDTKEYLSHKKLIYSK